LTDRLTLEFGDHQCLLDVFADDTIEYRLGVGGGRSRAITSMMIG